MKYNRLINLGIIYLLITGFCSYHHQISEGINQEAIQDFLSPKKLKTSNTHLINLDSEESTGNEDIATSAVTDKNGDIIVVGTIFSSRNMYPGQAEVTYISKFSSNGKLYWTQNITGPGGKWAHDVGIDSGDNIIVLGNVWNTIEFLGSEVPSTEGAAFLVKYTNNGEMLNHRIFGGTSFEGGPMGLDIDTEDNIIIAGREGSPGSDFPLKNASDSNYNGGASDVFVAKFSSTLDLIWSTFYGGIGEDGNADTGIV
ncbi:MAG: hypothetical protein ACW99Q_21365, partial [Candidatus Kariarchaeaceae archaeon]